MRKKIIFVLAAIALVAGVLILRENVAWKETPLFAMDTYCTLKIKGNDQTIEKMVQCIKEADDKFDAYDEKSAVYALNRTGKTEDKELIALTAQLIGYHQKTDGAFDFSMKKISDVWGFETETPSVPEEIDFSLFGADKVAVTDEKVTLDGVEVDFGGVAKGYVTDQLADILEQDGLEEALLDLGGNIYAKGTHKIGIKNPKEGENLACVIEVTDKAVITSGVYQRFFEDDKGKKWHHILNPETGYPADSGLLSVTVIGDNATECDVLSTAFLVMGREKALKLCEKFPVEVVLITKDSVYYTKGLEEKIQKGDPSYELKATF